MHLLKAQTATPEDVGAAVDLGQTPGDIVVLSAADTELACLAAAQARRAPGAPSQRLANLRQLGQPVSVESLLEAGWPGERVQVEAGLNRVHVALSTLRGIGLRDVLVNRDHGYLLDPDVRIVVE